MEERLPFVSVIIPVYNERDLLGKCLAALENQTYPMENHEILVVDNASKEDISEVVYSFGSNISLLKESKQGSYAARNEALRKSKGEILAFTDADCIPENDWLEQGVAALNSNNADLVGGRVELFPKNPEKPTGFEVVDLITAFPQRKYIQNRNFAVTANLLSKRKVFESVGSFNSDLESGGDMDFGQRAVTAGFNLVYGPDCIVHHPARPTLAHHRKKIARVARGKKAKGHLELDKNWRERTTPLFPPVIHSIKTTWGEAGLPLRSKVAGAFSLVAVHYIKELEDRRARKEIKENPGDLPRGF